MARTLRDLGEVRSLLRYWLGTVAYEESLASRPRAQKPSKRAGAVDLFDPGYGQPYFRLGPEHADLIVRGEGAAIVPLEGAVVGFFEHWLRAAYRREVMAARQERVDDSATRWVLGWPGILFERREELATVMRAPIELEWRKDGAPWRPPSYPDRRARKSAGPPDSVLIRALEVDAEDEDAVMVDRDLLNRVLGVLDEELEQLDDGLNDRARIAERVTRLLGGGDAKDVDATALFTAVLDAVRARLPDGVSVYPTAIVQDGALIFTTFHLQKELHELLGLGVEEPLSPGTVLWSYLTGEPQDAGWSPMRGRFRARGLTKNQRDTAELALGSRLAAVQGPPGTGKTELILNLAAHTLVTRIEALADGLVMSSAPVVVTSTNNRAVDNVTDPLGRELAPGRLPLALRTGNQDITATVTRDALERARTWLIAQDDTQALAKLNEALERFRTARAALDAASKPRVDRVVRRRKIAALRAELAALPAPEVVAAPHPLSTELRALEAIVERMARMARTRKAKAAKLDAAWTDSGADAIAEISARDPGLASSLALPPEETDAAERLEAWRFALDDAAELLEEELAEDSKRTRRSVKVERERHRVEGLLAKLEAREGEDDGEEGEGDEEPLAYAAFSVALEVRERWAIANKGELAPALEAAVKAASEDRSLKRFFADDPRARLALLRLYPVLGITLLSLGNVFDTTPEVIDHVIIDEAGQCHPAYAISGLMRARRALVIGDVHQLPPVLQLAEHDEERVRRRLGVKIPEERLAPYRVFASSTTSAQALADRAVAVRPTLVDHFRCQPPIIALSDALSGYGLEVHTPPRSLGATAPRLASAALFGATRGEQSRARGSWANAREAAVLARLLFELHGDGVPWSELGVLTPYVGQLELLRTMLRAEGVPFDVGTEPLESTLFGWASGDRGNLSLGTVHRFQGGERSVILFSTVITEARSLAFLDERPNLLNVAVSRARDHLVVLGDPATLARGRHTKLLVERCVPLALDGLV